MHRFAKPACWDNRHRGFESRPLRFFNFPTCASHNLPFPCWRPGAGYFVTGVDSIPLVGVFSVRFVRNPGSQPKSVSPNPPASLSPSGVASATGSFMRVSKYPVNKVFEQISRRRDSMLRSADTATCHFGEPRTSVRGGKRKRFSVVSSPGTEVPGSPSARISVFSRPWCGSTQPPTAVPSSAD